MCLIVISFQQNPGFPVLLAANRDEFYARPTTPLAWWSDQPGILAGRDLAAGGTWLGINRAGAFAAVTNYREPGQEQKQKKSRGLLVQNFLLSGNAEAYAETLVQTGNDYNGFNLLFGDRNAIYYFSNRANAKPEALKPGLYGLSNHLLDTPWPKVVKAKAGFAAKNPSAEDAFALLADRTPAADSEVQQTGLPPATEKVLSPLFIAIAEPAYGTRVSSFLQIDAAGGAAFHERTFNEGKFAADRVEKFLVES